MIPRRRRDLADRAGSGPAHRCAVRDRAHHRRPGWGERLLVRQEQSASLVADLEAWLREERSRLSRSAAVAQPTDYMLRRRERFAGFLDDGRSCSTNNAAERAARDFALGRNATRGSLRNPDEERTAPRRWRR